MSPTTATITPGTLPVPVPGKEKKRNTARNVALTALVLGGLTAGALGTGAGRNVLKRASRLGRKPATALDRRVYSFRLGNNMGHKMQSGRTAREAMREAFTETKAPQFFTRTQRGFEENVAKAVDNNWLAKGMPFHWRDR